ncbi:CHAT domain-containing protein [Allocoleopsis franciscana]|nr:tetratricopeptide repeat protein [Allocoleopsis franciscana]
MSNSNPIGITQKRRWLGLVQLISLSGITCLLLASQSFAATLEQMAPRIAQQPANSNAAEQVFQEAWQFYKKGTAESLRQAIPKFEQAIILSRQTGDKISEAVSLLALGRVYDDLGEKQKALEFYNQAFPLFQAGGNTGMEATTLIAIGSVYDDLGEKQKALEFYNQALPLFQAVEDRRMEASTLNNMGLVYDSLGKKQEALGFYNQALPLFQAVGYRPGEATTLNNMGLVYSSLGEKQKALGFFNQALPLFQVLGNTREEATTLNNIGFIYDSWGEKQKALEFFNQALPLTRAVGYISGEATTLNNMGLVYNSLGEKQKALEFFNQALPQLQAVGDRRGEGRTLNNIGFIYDSWGEKQKALEDYNQALLLYKAVGDRGGEATTLNNMGLVYSSLGEKQKALEFFNQALPLTQAVGDRGGEAISLNNIGTIYNSWGEKQKALESYNKALPLLRVVADRGGEALTLFNLAVLQRSQGNLKQAFTLIDSAITIVEDLRTKIGSQELRASYFATVQDYYQFYIDLLMQLHQQNPNQGYDALALHASERGRARSLLELLTEANANIRQGVDPKLLEQESTLTQQLNALERRRYELSSGQYTEQQLDEIKQQSESLLTQLDQLKAQIRVTSPRYAALKYPEPLNLQQIQQQVLDDDTLLLEYSLGEDRSYLWLVSKNSITSYVLPKRSEIEAAAQTFRESLTPNSAANLETGLPLSQMLLAPVANQLGNKRLLIVGDGALQSVPFAALPIPSSPTTPLLVQNEIITLPSASTVAIQQRQLQNRPIAAKTLAVVADPIFALNDPRFSTTPQQTPETPTNSALTRATRNLGLGDSAKVLDRLQYTGTEAKKILALVPATQSLQALDFNASRTTATDPNLAQYQIIHLATHGLLDPINPELSGIVLSLYDQKGKSQDGFLRLQDIFNLNLPAELVVLSACETGLGKDVKGEGLVGLTRGFMYAGSRRVVVSLWSVNDVATSEVMAKFYQKMLTEGQNPISALRAAQLEMWKSQNWQSPYYWAAFTVQGDWR